MHEIGDAVLRARSAAGQVAMECADGIVRGVMDAALLRRCCRELRGEVDPRGLRLRSARIAGCLDLSGLEVPFLLDFEDCEFDSPLLIEGARPHELALRKCAELPGLLANGARGSRVVESRGAAFRERLPFRAGRRGVSRDHVLHGRVPGPDGVDGVDQGPGTGARIRAGSKSPPA